MSFDIESIKAGEIDYPLAFRGLKGMPELLYYKGDISILNKMRSIAIIGSRECSDKALSFSHMAGKVAAELGINVINGLALGCDTAALEGALEKSGKCVAVMPGGLSRIFPKSNEKLALKILEKGGCLISEYAPDVMPQRYMYVQRDRLQSALAQAVLVAEAGMDSGTMHTVNAAIKQNKNIAAYIDALVKATGNEYVISHNGKEIVDESSLHDYLVRLPGVDENMQLSLWDMS